MTDQTETKKTSIVGNISVPDEWKIRHYTVYMNARQKYETAEYAEKREPLTAISRYKGSVAVIDAGFVHVPSEIKPFLAMDFDDLPLAFTGTIVRAIAFPIEAALNTDFLA